MALPNDKISTTLVANTLGTGSRDVGTLCTHQAINKWSRFKPVKYAGITIPDNVRSSDTGFEAKTIAGEDINTMSADYVKPTGGGASPYRLGDFRGYNHAAKAWSQRIPKITYVGAPPETNIYLQVSDTEARWEFEVVLPDFPIWHLPLHPNIGADSGKITITRGKMYTSSFIEKVGEIDIKALCGSNVTTYANIYANKAIKIPCIQRGGLPLQGYTANHTYYVYCSGLLLSGINYNISTGVMYRRWVQNSNDESQWTTSIDVSIIPPLQSQEVPYSSIRGIRTVESTDKSGLWFRGFRNTVATDLEVQYYYGGTWRRLAIFRRATRDGDKYDSLASGVVALEYFFDKRSGMDLKLRFDNGQKPINQIRISAIDVPK